MAAPSECKMPDLSGLDSPLIGRLIVQLLGGEPDLSQKARLYRRNFVRLVDVAVREHNAAREALLGEIQGRQRTFVIEFTNHMEACINAVRRLFKLLQRIKLEKESPAIPIELRRLVETKNRGVADIRNAVEHIDKDIQKGEITLGEPIMLTVSNKEDGVVISKYELKFEELATVIKKMHEIALYLLAIKKIETA